MTLSARTLAVALFGATVALTVSVWWQSPAHAQAPGSTLCTVLQLGIAESPQRVESRAVLVPQGWRVVGAHPSGAVICSP